MSATATPTPVPAPAGTVRLTTAALTQYLSSQSALHDSLTGTGRRRVVLLRSVPQWEGAVEPAWGAGQRARVAKAPSPLAVHELVIGHLGEAEGPRVLVVLTDREQTELDPAVLARVYRQRVESVDRWDVVREAFGAEDVDPRLKEDAWAAESLLDATPPSGWPTVAGGVLSRRAALTALTLRRLRLGRYETDRDQGGDTPHSGESLDTHALLRWSLTRGGPEHLLALRGPERAGLGTFLGEPEQAGPTGRVLLALITAEHGPDAVAFGLVCSALWDEDREADAPTYRARGRAERWLGEEPPASGDALDLLLAAFGRSCAEYVEVLLKVGLGDGDAAREALRTTGPVLERASRLVSQFGAETAAAASPVLREGLNARFAEVGQALVGSEAGSGTGPGAVAPAVRALDEHKLAGEADTGVRIERARMGQRLAQWLAGDPATGSDTVAAAVRRQVTDIGWVDRALDHIEAGGDPDPDLRAAYSHLGGLARKRRRAIDRSFARDLAEWTTAGTDPGSMLTVESFLERIVRPVVADRHGHRVLLLLLDGMSAAIATELAEELRRHWAEYDPLPAPTDSAGLPPERRGMAAALPTLTAVSRTSLFAGQLMKGTQSDEKRLFPQHRFWRGVPATVFHKDELRTSDTGDTFGSGLTEALADEGTHVAVVLNTIDDRLGKEQKLGDGAWRLSDVGKLKELLREAAAQGMAVILTSDHGHVVDRHGSRVETDGAVSARHREPGGLTEESEVVLSGPRVVWPEPGSEIVALWDADSRYTGQKAGYHGGASPAEFTIPVLAFLPFGAEPPKGWRELGDQHPRWWETGSTPSAVRAVPAVMERPAPDKRARPTKQQAEIARTHDALFDLGPESAQPTPPAAPATKETEPALVDRLMATETFQAQVELLARKPNPTTMGRIRQAVEVLLDVGTLPTTALAQRVGHPQTRADGFAAVLRQLLNYDGVQVLETLPDGRTLRLDEALLREQFEL
ncbi:BREX-2 system phosphatase PglZ [Nocardiopsis sp. JB363]|uniref:BREX-2 system phosphatase PglZ n=1 Tax=Nocardiopsis sp. JB363 TaxID=1434837 RepID=UPI00097B3D49|nr:BREX-2 system phosphatase PglZ [Nocardiopsis sp. JB363]SIO85592.1 Bacteriophage (PhiC31) resistance gene pglZ [Nocardiopsis sp. JB363]